jgi:hypothetical protein
MEEIIWIFMEMDSLIKFRWLTHQFASAIISNARDLCH